ncbi:hypothetical protein ANTRET_LOCUS2528 [Anthophora retusa]
MGDQSATAAREYRGARAQAAGTTRGVPRPVRRKRAAGKQTSRATVVRFIRVAASSSSRSPLIPSFEVKRHNHSVLCLFFVCRISCVCVCLSSVIWSRLRDLSVNGHTRDRASVTDSSARKLSITGDRRTREAGMQRVTD